MDLRSDEIIAIDDGSTDEGHKTIEGLPITLVRLPRSFGPAAARNSGLEAARGEFVTFLDSDDILLPRALSERIAYLQEHPQEVAVGGTCHELIDANSNVIGPYDSIHFYDVANAPYRLTRDFLSNHRSLPVHLWLVLFRREIFEKMGPLDHWLRCGEDLEFFCRVLQNHSIPFIQCPVAQYRIHDSNLSLRKTPEGFKSTETAVASQFLICHKHGLRLKESPFLSRTDFRFAELTVRLTHPNDLIGKKIEEEYGRWKTTESGATPEATFRIEAGQKPKGPEDGAIRVRFWEEFKSYAYSLGRITFELFQDNYFAKKNFDQMKVEISYLKLEGLVGQLGLSAFKWTVIKGLEKKGYGYIHGACLSFNAKLVIFSGDPGSGKSSSLKRLVARGAKAICDDTVLFKETEILPFDHTPTMRGDFRTRFRVPEGIPPLEEKDCVTHPTTEPVSVVVFPRVWQSEKSEWRRLTPEDGLQRLIAIYTKETEWNTYPEPLDDVRGRYDVLLSRAVFFEFLQGKLETEVEASLWSGLKDYLNA